MESCRVKRHRGKIHAKVLYFLPLPTFDIVVEGGAWSTQVAIFCPRNGHESCPKHFIVCCSLATSTGTLLLTVHEYRRLPSAGAVLLVFFRETRDVVGRRYHGTCICIIELYKAMGSPTDAVEFDPFTLKSKGTTGGMSIMRNGGNHRINGGPNNSNTTTTNKNNNTAMSLSDVLEKEKSIWTTNHVGDDQSKESSKMGKTYVVSDMNEAVSIFDQAFGDGCGTEDCSASFADDIDSFVGASKSVFGGGCESSVGCASSSENDFLKNGSVTTATTAPTTSDSDTELKSSKQSLSESPRASSKFFDSNIMTLTNSSSSFDRFQFAPHAPPLGADSSAAASNSTSGDKSSTITNGMSRQRMIAAESRSSELTASNSSPQRQRSSGAVQLSGSSSEPGARSVFNGNSSHSSNLSAAARGNSQLFQMSVLVSKQHLRGKGTEPAAATTTTGIAGVGMGARRTSRPRLQQAEDGNDDDEALLHIEAMNERHAMQARKQRIESAGQSLNRSRNGRSNDSSASSRPRPVQAGGGLEQQQEQQTMDCPFSSPSRRRSTGSYSYSDDLDQHDFESIIASSSTRSPARTRSPERTRSFGDYPSRLRGRSVMRSLPGESSGGGGDRDRQGPGLGRSGGGGRDNEEDSYDDVDIEAMNQRHASRARQQRHSSRFRQQQQHEKRPEQQHNSGSGEGQRSESRINHRRSRSRSRSRRNSRTELRDPQQPQQPQHQQAASNDDLLDQRAAETRGRSRSKEKNRSSSPRRGGGRKIDRRSSQQRWAPGDAARATADCVTRAQLVNKSNEGALVIDKEKARQIVAALFERRTREKTAHILAKQDQQRRQSDESAKRVKMRQAGESKHMVEVNVTPTNKPGVIAPSSTTTAERETTTATMGGGSSHPTNQANSKPSKNAFLKDFLRAVESCDPLAEADHVRIICPVVAKKLNSRHGVSLTEDDLMRMGLPSVVKGIAQSTEALGMIEEASDKKMMESVIQKLLEIHNNPNHTPKAEIRSASEGNVKIEAASLAGRTGRPASLSFSPSELSAAAATINGNHNDMTSKSEHRRDGSVMRRRTTRGSSRTRRSRSRSPDKISRQMATYATKR